MLAGPSRGGAGLLGVEPGSSGVEPGVLGGKAGLLGAVVKCMGGARENCAGFVRTLGTGRVWASVKPYGFTGISGIQSGVWRRTIPVFFFCCFFSISPPINYALLNTLITLYAMRATTEHECGAPPRGPPFAGLPCISKPLYAGPAAWGRHAGRPPFAGPPFAGLPFVGPPIAGPPFAGPPFAGPPFDSRGLFIFVWAFCARQTVSRTHVY